jgi:hypothetical protein
MGISRWPMSNVPFMSSPTARWRIVLIRRVAFKRLGYLANVVGRPRIHGASMSRQSHAVDCSRGTFA